MRPLPLAILAFAVTVLLTSNSQAQEVGFIDLTKIKARTEFRYPPPTGRADEPRGENLDDVFNCPHSGNDNAEFRTTLVSLDRSYYQVGDEPTFELTIENLVPAPLRIPFSPNVADLQPKDPAQKFSYSELQIELWIAGKEWRQNGGGGFSLYGDENHPETLVTLNQGEWVRIVGEGRFSNPVQGPVSKLIRSGQTVDRAYADVSLIRDEILLTAKSTARIRHKVCLRETWGRSIPIVLTNPEP